MKAGGNAEFLCLVNVCAKICVLFWNRDDVIIRIECCTANNIFEYVKLL